MNVIFRIVLPLLFIAFGMGNFGCQSSQIIVNQAARQFQPLSADTPVYFYDYNYKYGSINALKKALVLRAVCVSGKTAAIIDSGYFSRADKRPAWDGIGDRQVYEKAYPFGAESVKALLKELYSNRWKPFVPNISYIWIEAPGKTMDALSYFKAVKVSSAEMRYSGPKLKDWKALEAFKFRNWDYNDLPKIADAALKHGSNIVILDDVRAKPQTDEKGNHISRKVEVSRKMVKVEKGYDSQKGSYSKYTYNVEYEDRLIFSWWSGEFDLIRIEGLIRQKH